MAEKVKPVLDKVLAFRISEVLDTIRATASRKGWSIMERERGENASRLTVRLPATSAEFIFAVSRMEARAISGSFKMPQTRLCVWTGGTDDEAAGEIAEAMHIAFLRAGG